VSLLTLPQKIEEKSLTVFLKTKLRIKESFISKHLGSAKGEIVKSMETKTSSYNPIVGQMNIDFLLSIYTSIKNEQSSIYNLPEASKDLVDKNRAKDEVIFCEVNLCLDNKEENPKHYY
jgi:hypothetical protein